jgi:hypothetical protein
MWYLLQGSIIIAVVAHEHFNHWNTTGNKLVPSVLGGIIAYIVTLLLVHFGRIESPRAAAIACFLAVMGYALLGPGG